MEDSISIDDKNNHDPERGLVAVKDIIVKISEICGLKPHSQWLLRFRDGGLTAKRRGEECIGAE